MPQPTSLPALLRRKASSYDHFVGCFLTSLSVYLNAFARCLQSVVDAIRIVRVLCCYNAEEPVVSTRTKIRDMDYPGSLHPCRKNINGKSAHEGSTTVANREAGATVKIHAARVSKVQTKKYSEFDSNTLRAQPYGHPMPTSFLFLCD